MLRNLNAVMHIPSLHDMCIDMCVHVMCSTMYVSVLCVSNMLFRGNVEVFLCAVLWMHAHAQK